MSHCRARHTYIRAYNAHCICDDNGYRRRHARRKICRHACVRKWVGIDRGVEIIYYWSQCIVRISYLFKASKVFFLKRRILFCTITININIKTIKLYNILSCSRIFVSWINLRPRAATHSNYTACDARGIMRRRACHRPTALPILHGRARVDMPVDARGATLMRILITLCRRASHSRARPRHPQRSECRARARAADSPANANINFVKFSNFTSKGNLDYKWKLEYSSFQFASFNFKIQFL